MTTIDMTPYGLPNPLRDNRKEYYLHLADGKKDAIACGLKEAVLAGKVSVVFPAISTCCVYELSRSITEEYLKGFVGDTARAVGIDFFIDRVTFRGEKIRGGRHGSPVWYVEKYLESEEKRLAKKVKDLARAQKQNEWSEDFKFLIPEIGTVIQLVEDWTFPLYRESRNNALIKSIRCKEASWSDQGQSSNEVTIKAGSILSVDRVYIRKGISNYSSLTFNLFKNSTVVSGGIDFKGSGRFWAKLRDVNRMKVRVDLGTLSGK